MEIIHLLTLITEGGKQMYTDNGELDKKDILKLKIESDDRMSTLEKETTTIINDRGLIVHSDHRTGIKWCVRQLRENRAELLHYNVYGNCLVGIGIKTDVSLITLKSKPRQQKHISNCFSI